MNKQEIYDFIKNFLDTDETNVISEARARNPEYAGVRFFNDPLVGYASADDDYLALLKNNTAANIDLMQPKEWLPEAKTVISFFLPFTDEIIKDNYPASDKPSELWQQARPQGQECNAKLTEALKEKLNSSGYDTIAPLTDPRLDIFMKLDGHPESLYTSNWSERHIAYATGLGTFSLATNIITEKGTAGRFGSVVTTCEFEPTKRPYKELTEYCIMCGACARRCPGNAIDVKTGKKELKMCDDYLISARSPDRTYYGSGICQCNVPCETSIPRKPAENKE